jgi:hypothetical protein
MALPFSVKTRLLLAAVLLLSPLPLQAQEPDPHEILRTVRAAQASQNQTMTGRIRTGGKSTPFRLVLAGKTARYEFSDPPQTLILRLQDRDSRLEEVTGGGSRAVTPARYDTQVRDTDISYEDLALKFLYGHAPRLEGRADDAAAQVLESGRAARLRRDSQSSRATLWIDKESGALMAGRGVRQERNFARRSSDLGQKVNGLWFLKQMRIEAPRREKSRDRTPTYLEVQSIE